MDNDDAAQTMAVGQRYQVRYRSETQRRDRTAVMVFLGQDGDGLVFDARPAAGTQHMPRAWVRGAEPVPTDAPAYINKVAP